MSMVWVFSNSMAFDFLRLDLDELALGQLVAATFILVVNDAAGLFIDHLLA
jgi:hypothetical protein